MDLEKLLKDFGKSLGKLIANKREDYDLQINIEKADAVDTFKIVFNKLIHDKNYNKAEDFLFEELHKNNSYEIYEIALKFYDLLQKKNDEELENSNFSREEIFLGINDLRKLVNC